MNCQICIKHNVIPCFIDMDSYLGFQSYICAINKFEKILTHYQNFNEILQTYILFDNSTYFLKALELTNIYWFNRLEKLIILK